MSEEKNTPEVPDHIPRVHQPGNGISEAHARELDLARYLMEQGDPDGNSVRWDSTSETESNLHASELGTGSHSLHKGVSSNSDMLFSVLVQKEKNEDPSIEHAEAYSRAVERFNAMQEDDEDV